MSYTVTVSLLKPNGETRAEEPTTLKFLGRSAMVTRLEFRGKTRLVVQMPQRVEGTGTQADMKFRFDANVRRFTFEHVADFEDFWAQCFTPPLGQEPVKDSQSVKRSADSVASPSGAKSMVSAETTPAKRQTTASSRARFQASTPTPPEQPKFFFNSGGSQKKRDPDRCSTLLQERPTLSSALNPVSQNSLQGAPLHRSHAYSSNYSSYKETPFREVAQREHGLRNLGNTCYLNAVAQALGSLREFAATLRELPKQAPKVSQGELFLRTTQLMERIGAPSSVGPFSPSQLRESIGKRAPMFAGGGQQDAHEFFLEWVNQLHDETLSRCEAEVSEGLVLATQRHFDSEVVKRLDCTACEASREVHERFWDFSLDFDKAMPDPVLEFMLKAYFDEERLEARCERCSHDQARMTKALAGAPRVLVLHLKRFVPNVAKQCYEKQHGNVSIPLELDLAQCVADARPAHPSSSPSRPVASPSRSSFWPAAPAAAGAPRALGAAAGAAQLVELDCTHMGEFGTEAAPPLPPPLEAPPPEVKAAKQPPHHHVEAPQPSSLVYQLRAVVAHEGTSPRQGHYVTYARGEGGAWRLYDDAHVKDVDRDPTPHLGRRAYILFYVQRGASQ